MLFDCPRGTTGKAKYGCDYRELADQFTALYPDMVLPANGKGCGIYEVIQAFGSTR